MPVLSDAAGGVEGRSMVEGFLSSGLKNPSTACGGPPPQQLLGRI
jgi:hypothetical protein